MPLMKRTAEINHAPYHSFGNLVGSFYPVSESCLEFSFVAALQLCHASPLWLATWNSMDDKETAACKYVLCVRTENSGTGPAVAVYPITKYTQC